MKEMRFNQCVKVYPQGLRKETTFNYNVYNPFKLYTFKNKSRTKYSKENNITREDSLKRCKDKIFDLALLNSFDYFVTFTLDSQKIDRYDYSLIQSKLKNWLKNNSARNDLKYLVVPELHQDGAVHFHGLISGNLKLIDSGLKHKDGRTIYNADAWHYGFTTVLELTGEYIAVARYITKYVTKDTKRILGNMYYAGGKNLLREPLKEYARVNFQAIDSKSYDIPNTTIKCKYNDYYKEL